MESISELLFLLKDLFTVSKLIAELNVLKTVLMHFRVLGFISSFPVVNHSSAQRLVGSAEHGILGDGTLKLLELMLNLLTLSLLLVKLGLKFGSHSVVTLLGLFQVESNLMDVSQSVKIFMFVKELSVLLHFVVTLTEFVFDNSLLEFSVGLLEVLVFPEFVSNSADELLTHFTFLREIMEVVFFFLLILLLGLSAFISGVLTLSRATGLHLGGLGSTHATRLGAGSTPRFTFRLFSGHAFAFSIEASSLVLESGEGLLLGFTTDLVFSFLVLSLLFSASSGLSLLHFVVLSILSVFDLSTRIGIDI
jgi:hypothetical protein